MKKIITIFSLIFVFLFGCGCSNSTQNEMTVPNTSEMVLNNFYDTYHRYAITENYLFDIDKLENYFIDDIEQYEDDIAYSEFSGAQEYRLDIDNVTYLWMINPSANEISFRKEYQNKNAEVIESDRLKIEEYLKNLEVQLVLDKVMEDGATKIYNYRQVLGGVEVSDSPDGPMVTVTIDGNGSAYNIQTWLIQETKVIESYNVSEFLSVDSVCSRAMSYCKKYAEDYDIKSSDVELEIKEINMIYYCEDRKELVPAYEIHAEEKIKGRIYEVCYTMDALTGHVYHRSGDGFWADLTYV